VITFPAVSNHPNRCKDRGPGSNPKPEEILRAREAAGLTQEEAGVLLFSGWRSWQDWERGERRMHPATWELFNIKVRARKLLADEAIAADLVKRLGIHLPPTD
jgi:DNA-binding transcriptional regulator YiaG